VNADLDFVFRLPSDQRALLGVCVANGAGR
jgi:hypothetical protein